jgi:hypothetical protein
MSIPRSCPKGVEKAIRYTHNIFHKLTRYHLDGRLKIDNNLGENAIRPIALGRKNWFSMEMMMPPKMQQSCIPCQLLRISLTRIQQRNNTQLTRKEHLDGNNRPCTSMKIHTRGSHRTKQKCVISSLLVSRLPHPD